MSSDLTGRSVGAYRVTAKLGEGGMGEVWRATDTRLKRDVAIKVLPAAFTADAERLARFEREAQLLAQLQHPNIAAIHGMEESDGTRALVLELVEGPTLAERLESGPLPLDEALSIARQIAEALEEAHEKGVIHRDLKPQNVKASVDGRVKVLDFGLAKAMDPTGTASGAASASQLAASPTLTLGASVHGMVLGTAAYMAPEQAKGFAVDKRADIWAFGVVLYEMLTGVSPFVGDSVPDTLARVLQREIDFAAVPESTPPAIRRLLRRCLERNPKDRLRDIGDARLVLSDTIAGRAEPAGRPTAGTGPSAVSPIVVAAGAIALAIAGYVVGQRTASAPDVTADPRSPSFQKLTSSPGMELGPALSPDGKSLFFSAAHADRGDADIYFLPVGGSKPIDLTPDSEDDDTYPAVSPDGRQIAFRSERGGGGVFLMGTTGESVRRLTDDCFDPAWSPDGVHLACTGCASGDPLDRPCRGALRVFEVASGASRTIEVADAAAPAWSPDGRRIAFWGLHATSPQRDVWTVAVEGGAPVPVTEDAAVDWNPVWSADGAALAFLSDRGGTAGLWRVALDPASGRPLGPPRSVVLPTELAFEIRRSGDRWAYVSLALRARIDRHTFDADRLAIVGAPRTVVATTGRMQSAAVSPDGRWIAYASYFPRQDLFVVSSDGGQPVQLTDDPAIDRFPTWDPNGERILFMSNRGGRYDMWAILADGSGLQRLTEMTEEARWVPLLSPDRTRLSSISQRGLSIFDARGPAPWTRFERVADPQAEGVPRFEAWSWSPDGRRLGGFVRPRPGDLERGNRAAYWSFDERRLHPFDVPGIGVAWFPDNRRLVVGNSAGGLKVLDVATGAVRPVAGGETPWDEARGSLSDDLRTIVDFRNDEEADIWLAEGIE